MDSLLSSYIVMQQAEWAGRMFYQAQDRQSGDVIYLIAEPVRGSMAPYAHINLPPLEEIAVEGATRWLGGGLTGGESLEDLRRFGFLTEQEILTALLSVIDALASLSQFDPPIVPAYLDPACIKVDLLGRWTLDYLALAQAPEANSVGSPPLGIYPFGVLLYWLATGQIVRRTRVQVDRVAGLSVGLQFILVRCLGRAYPSLAELRADVERAGREREFRSLVQLISGRQAQNPQPSAADLPMELRRVTMGGPFIPADDRPWALPPRPADGFHKFVVPPEPNPRVRRAARLGLAAAASFALVALTGAVLLRLGEIPATRPELSTAPMTTSGTDDHLLISDRPVVQTVTLQPVPEPPPDDSPPESPPPSPPPPIAKPAVSTPPSPPPTPPPPEPPPTPAQPKLQPGTTDYEDARLGSMPMQLHLDGRSLGYAYLFPSAHSPHISLEAFNRLFGRTLFWAPHDGGQIRLLAGTRVVITADYSLVDDRVWLKLTPALQEALGLKLQAYTADGLHFSTVP